MIRRHPPCARKTRSASHKLGRNQSQRRAVYVSRLPHRFRTRCKECLYESEIRCHIGGSCPTAWMGHRQCTGRAPRGRSNHRHRASRRIWKRPTESDPDQPANKVADPETPTAGHDDVTGKDQPSSDLTAAHQHAGRESDHPTPRLFNAGSEQPRLPDPRRRQAQQMAEQ